MINILKLLEKTKGDETTNYQFGPTNPIVNVSKKNKQLYPYCIYIM